MTELLLDRLALKKLNVVDNEDIYHPKTFLKSDRCLRLEGGDKTIHESLRGEIDDPPLGPGGGMRDSLEKMGLPQSDRGMEIERIVVQRVRWSRTGDPLRLRCRELIGTADQEIRSPTPEESCPCSATESSSSKILSVPRGRRPGPQAHRVRGTRTRMRKLLPRVPRAAGGGFASTLRPCQRRRARRPFRQGPLDRKFVCANPASGLPPRDSRQGNGGRANAGAKDVMMSVKTGWPRD